MPPSSKDRLVSFLRWTEKYTKTDMVYLASGGFWGVAAQISAMVITLALSIVIARYVPKDAYGTYKYILGIVALLSVFSLNNVSGAVMQSVVHGFTGAVEDGFKATLRWSFIVFLGAFALGAYYLFAGNTTLGLGILLGGCAAPFLAGYNLYLPLLSGKKDFRRVAWYSGFVTNIVPAILLIVIAITDPRPLPLLAAYFFGNIAAAAYAYYRARERYRSANVSDPEMLRYGKHLSVIGILGGIADNIDQILLFHFVGPAQLAVYNFAIALPDQAKGPLKNLDSMMQAQFSGRTDREIRIGMTNKILWVFLACAAGILVYVLLAPFVFRILFPKYIEAAAFSQLYALAYLANSLNPAISYLSVRKKVREQYVSAIANAIMRIAAMTIGVVTAGLVGLILARIVSRAGYLLLNYALYRRSVAPA